MPLRLRLPLSIALLLSACGFDRPVAPTDRIPVIYALLVAGTDGHFIDISLGQSADSAWDPYGPPDLPTTVDLTLTGNDTTVTLTYGGRGAFFTLPIYPDSTYQLSGTIDGTPVSAITHVPHELTITDPVGDTIYVDTLADCPTNYCTLSLGLAGVEVEGFSGDFRAGDGGLIFSALLDAPRASVLIGPQTTRHIASIDLYGYDRNAALYYLQAEPKSSIEGAFGMFGSAVVARRKVRMR